MSCFIAPLQGGDPRREIFPIPVDTMAYLQSAGMAEMASLLGVQGLAALPLNAAQHIGAALKPDGTAFYLTTIAPDFGPTADPVGHWRGVPMSRRRSSAPKC